MLCNILACVNSILIKKLKYIKVSKNVENNSIISIHTVIKISHLEVVCINTLK